MCTEFKDFHFKIYTTTRRISVSGWEPPLNVGMEDLADQQLKSHSSPNLATYVKKDPILEKKPKSQKFSPSPVQPDVLPVSPPPRAKPKEFIPSNLALTNKVSYDPQTHSPRHVSIYFLFFW